MLHWQGEDTAAKVIQFGALRKNADGGALAEVISMLGTRMRFDRNAEIFGEDEPADYLYQVVSGAVRTAKLLSDGRRQIGAFYLAGDVFGLENEEVHLFSAEAVTECVVLVVKRSAFLAEAARHSAIGAQLWNDTMVHFNRAQSHMLLLGRKNAMERIAAFLVELAGRLRRTGDLELPMSRQDIADYLGLTIETVSRTLTQLEREGVISIPAARRIVFRNRAALDNMNECLAA
jgi:CRP/FNR family nitrogen fixation transcriptional regulator